MNAIKDCFKPNGNKTRLDMKILLVLIICFILSGCRGLVIGTVAGTPTIATLQGLENEGLGGVAAIPVVLPFTISLHGAISYGLFVLNPALFGIYMGGSALYGMYVYEYE